MSDETMEPVDSVLPEAFRRKVFEFTELVAQARQWHSDAELFEELLGGDDWMVVTARRVAEAGQAKVDRMLDEIRDEFDRMMTEAYERSMERVEEAMIEGEP